MKLFYKMDPRLRGDDNRGGYFLIELLVVLALFALMCGGGLYTTTFFNRLLVRTELQKLEMACQALRWQAISTGQQKELVFDINNNSYVYNKVIISLPRQLAFGVAPNVKGPPASPNRIITKPVTFVDNIITFAPTGIISSGTVYLKDTTNSVLYALTNAVSPFSLMRLYRYVHKQWQLI